MAAEAENGNARKNGKEWRRDVHPGQQKKSHAPAKQADGFKKKAEQDSRAHTKPSGWTCGECLQRFPERDAYVSHVKTAHTKVRGHEFLTLECLVRRVLLKDHPRGRGCGTCDYTK